MRKLIILLSVIVIVSLSGCNFPGLWPINTAPVANFIYIPANPTINVAVNFDASGSNDKEDGKNLAVRWDFNNDGNWEIDYSHGKKVSDTVSHTYTIPGKYTVKLEVRDSSNVTALTVKEVTVAGGNAPIANFTYTPVQPYANIVVTFNPALSTDDFDSKENLSVRWDFNGDGIWEIDYANGYKASQTASYTYMTADIYEAILEVKDSAGLTASTSRQITVQSNSIPQAEFTIDSLIVIKGMPVNFNASASTDVEDGSNLKARWDFNSDGIWEIDYTNGKTVADIVTYSYNIAGIYNVTLEVMDQFTAKNNKVRSVTVIEEQSSSALRGYIVESRGGSGIANAAISITSVTGNTMELTTAADGSFAVTLIPGKYQVVVTKNGYAVSKVQDLILTSDEEFELELPLREKFYPAWPIAEPTLSITGLTDSTAVTPLSGEINFAVQCASTLGIKVIEVRFGQQGLDVERVSYEKNSYEVYFNTSLLPDGKSFIKISVYDADNNYVETYKTIFVSNQPFTPQLDRPTIIELGALTFGQSLGLMKEEPKILALKGTQKVDVSQVWRACRVANTTIATMLEWDWIPAAAGYKVYRSFTNGADYKVIATTANTYFIDTSALLAPDKPVYYRISAFDGNIESELSALEYTIPLAPFNVSLQSPTQGQILNTPLPDFTWTYDQIGKSQNFHLVVQGVTDYSVSMEDYLESVGSTAYSGSPLVSGKEYEWDIIEAYAFTGYSVQAYAMSFSGQGAGATNGAFRFVTNF